MRIGIVCPYDMVRGGGVQEHVLAQAKELVARGHKVKILTPKPRGQSVTQIEGVELILLGSSTMVKTPVKTSLELGASFKPDQVDEVLAQEKFDLLHIHEPEVPMLGAQIVAKATCPIVATFHAIHPETPMGRTIERFRIPYSRSLLSRLTAMTAVSEAAAGFVRERTGRPVTIIPNGVDLKKYRFRPLKQLPGTKTLLYVGRLEKRKGLVHLLKAYARLARQRDDLELVLAGQGPQRVSLEEYVSSNRIPRVHFLGFVDEPTKLKLLHQASLFISPAVYGESFGIVLLEAMASGTVIVAADNVGYAGVMTGSGQVSLVNPKDTLEFARRIDMLLNDEGLRQLWLEWAKAAINQFDYPKIVDAYVKLYKDVLKKS